MAVGFGESHSIRTSIANLLSRPITVRAALILTFIFIAIAAYLVRENLLWSLATLAVGFGFVFFIVHAWFEDEARRRRVQQGDETPLPADADNPDMRDDILITCAALLLLTPLLLQALNTSFLHYSVANDPFGIGGTVCANATPGTFCGDNKSLWQLPSWILFTLKAFAKIFPGGDELGQYFQSWIGITPTERTPIVAEIGLQLLFVGFLGTLVLNQLQRVGSGISDAIGTLKLSHQYAAGLGPIVLTSLCAVIHNNDAKRSENAIRAVAQIGRTYSKARGKIRDLFEDHLLAIFRTIKPKEAGKADLLAAIAGALSAMNSDAGIAAVRERITRNNEYVNTRKMMLRSMRDNLDAKRALDELQALQRSLPTNASAQLRGLLAQLLNELAPSADEEDTQDPASNLGGLESEAA